jgi:4'-phosphopantetheinyl transferase EntD
MRRGEGGDLSGSRVSGSERTFADSVPALTDAQGDARTGGLDACVALLRPLLPPSVAVHELRGYPERLELYRSEEAAVSQAVSKRRREFAAVRYCARRALADLGLPPAPILPGRRGAPQWPAGVVGSMTHCPDFSAAAVVPARDVTAIGIDAEVDASLPDGILDLIALPDEAAVVRDLCRRRPEIHWDRLLFSIKESVYKAWSPLSGSWLDFHEARVTFHPCRQSFVVQLLGASRRFSDAKSGSLRGHWACGGRILVSAVILPSRPE